MKIKEVEEKERKKHKRRNGSTLTCMMYVYYNRNGNEMDIRL